MRVTAASRAGSKRTSLVLPKRDWKESNGSVTRTHCLAGNRSSLPSSLIVGLPWPRSSVTCTSGEASACRPASEYSQNDSARPDGFAVV